MEYNFSKIEKKWQQIWEKDETYKTDSNRAENKYYALIEFPYPSAEGLHVGQSRPYTALDVISRKRRREGYDVMFCMGWDAFGLPTENFAIKHNVQPQKISAANIARFRKQLKSLGYSFDWSREISTCDPEYYKWTQWIFLKLYEHGLAYKDSMPINYCTSCRVGLANEEVVNGACERCGGEVVRKEKSQWMLRITKYAQRLLDGLDDLDFIEKVKAGQRHWIGRSEGAEVNFAIKDAPDKIRVYTTRPDTLYGATYMVLSPEHALIEKYKDRIENMQQVEAYQREAARKSDFERTLDKEKTGVLLKGIMAVNPVSDAEIPIFISDYVLTSYGTGAIMAVPAHDLRDWDFAKKFGLPIIEVVKSDVDVNEKANPNVDEGVMVNSPIIDGLQVKDAIVKIIQYLTQKGLGESKVNYKLRDWVFTRQRYWGEPIPIVHCDACGYVPLPYDSLPLELPHVEDFVAGENGESPLERLTHWIETTCPKCGGAARRETDTMPNWAGSSWYFLRYIDPHNDGCVADYDLMQKWLPVDWYNGGMEHVTLHLLYSRFWHQFLYDIGVVPTPEPYNKRTAHGMILGENGEKMSKSRGNVVNPDDVVREYGADSLRTFIMFIGAFDQPTMWSDQGMRGCHKFIERVWNLYGILTDEPGYSQELESATHKMIKKVSHDIEQMKYNTAIACMMGYINDVYKKGSITRGEFKALLQLLNPFAPHMTEELWQRMGESKQLSYTAWPCYDEQKTQDQIIQLPIQINGKVRGKIYVEADADEQTVEQLCLQHDKIQQYIQGKQIVKFILVAKKIVNIIVK